MIECELDTSCTDEIVCPYCGSEETDSWEFKDETDIIECSSCGEKFEYSRITIVSYDTRKLFNGESYGHTT